MTTRKLWLGFLAVMTISFAVLLYYGREIYRQAPPIPDKVVSSNGTILFTGQDIKDDQNVWQSIGGQKLGTVWRYGSHMMPDWTADWLLRECKFFLNSLFQLRYVKQHIYFPAEIKAQLDIRPASMKHKNTYDAAKRRIVTDSIRVVYGTYLILVCLFFVWFVWKVRRPATSPQEEKMAGMDRREILLFSILATVLIFIHVITLSNIVPWQKWRLWSKPQTVGSYHIGMSDYEFKFPEKPLTFPKGSFVEFVLTSEDVTYGFGVFRKNGTLVFQMQVLPGYKNRYVWNFSEPGYYDVRSTEYSGPRHSEMVMIDAIRVLNINKEE